MQAWCNDVGGDEGVARTPRSPRSKLKHAEMYVITLQSSNMLRAKTLDFASENGPEGSGLVQRVHALMDLGGHLS